MFVQKTFKNNLPTLYLVGTPIGNLDDMSLRAIQVLKEVDYILCEDTRTSSVLLKHYQIEKPLISLHKYNELERADLIASYLNQHHNLALISDAGVPIISDPGAWLTNQLRYKLKVDFNISAINCGPAYIHGICVSAFVQKTNYFAGFIEAKSPNAKRKELAVLLEDHPNTLVCFYESVHRIKDTIATLATLLEDYDGVEFVVCRELTKLNEEIIYGTPTEISAFMQSDDFVVKGEFVIIINNLKQVKEFSNEQIFEMIKTKINEGTKLKEAVSIVSDSTKLNKNQLYKLYLTESGKNS